MVRSILAVVAGYLAMGLLVFVLFSAAYLLMGADGAFRPGTYEVSALWLASSFVLGLVAALVGGYVCAVVARGGRAPLALACLVLILGLVAFALSQRGDGGDAVRAGRVSNSEARQRARTPAWVALLNPVVGAAGVLVGARLRRE
jgi:hypothetical protein